MANDFKRMQLIAGLITESEYRESINEEETIFADYSTNNDNSIKTKLARNLAEEIHSLDVKEGTIDSLFTGEMEQYAEGNDDFYANKEEALKAFAELPDTFTIMHNIDGNKVKISITKTGPKSWKVNESESQIDEAENDNMLTQNDIKTLYNNGFNIIAQPDWNFVRIQKDFKSLKADWRFLNNLLSSKNIPSDIDYWRGDGDKGRNKRLEISKKYFDKNIKYPAFKESQLNENKLYAMLATVADDLGEDSGIYNALKDAVIDGLDENGKLSPEGKIEIKNLLKGDLLDDYGHFLDENVNEGDTDYDRAEDAKRLGKKGEKNIYGAGVKKGEEIEKKKIEKKKMKMSELKAAIKELALSEADDEFNSNTAPASLYDPVYEASEFDMNKAARIEEFIIALNNLVDEYHSELYLNDDLFSAIEMVIKAAKEEAMNSELSEAKKDKEVEDTEDVDITVGDEETTADVTTTDVDPDVKAVQDALTQAQAAAEKLGDDKLTDQIGNTITFFTRSHIVDKPGVTAESNIKERISKLIKSLNETAVDEAVSYYGDINNLDKPGSPEKEEAMAYLETPEGMNAVNILKNLVNSESFDLNELGRAIKKCNFKKTNHFRVAAKAAGLDLEGLGTLDNSGSGDFAVRNRNYKDKGYAVVFFNDKFERVG